jgi:hypothetical protein
MYRVYRRRILDFFRAVGAVKTSLPAALMLLRVFVTFFVA